MARTTAHHGLPHWLIAGITAAAAIAVISVGSFLSTRCHADSCNNEAVIGDYCPSHVCLHSGCESQRSRLSSRGYCFYHDNKADENEQKAESEALANAHLDLSVSSVRLDKGSSSYTVAKGTLTNNGSRTYQFVQVKGAFKDSRGEVVDTDWTYACGSEGLAPGESTTFQLSVPKQYGIESCSVSILDYD